MPIRTQPLTDRIRKESGGRYIKLTGGVTHFKLDGPEDGSPLVLMHGATVPNWEFDRLVPRLVDDGFRILRFDLYGHGFSDRPQVDYTIELFAEQVIELIEAIGFPCPVSLLGHSMGAAVGSAVAVARPEWIERIVLMAPMLNFSVTNPWSRWLRRPVVGELIMRFFGLPALVRRRRMRYQLIRQPQLSGRFIEQAYYDGFWQAVLSMERCKALDDQSARYAALRALAHEILVLWGSDDHIVSASDIGRIRGLLPPHRFTRLDGAQHNLMLTHPESIAAAVQSFVRFPRAAQRYSG